MRIRATLCSPSQPLLHVMCLVLQSSTKRPRCELPPSFPWQRKCSFLIYIRCPHTPRSLERYDNKNFQCALNVCVRVKNLGKTRFFPFYGCHAFHIVSHFNSICLTPHSGTNRSKKCEAFAAHSTIRVESLLMRSTRPLAFGHVFLATTLCVPGKAKNAGTKTKEIQRNKGNDVRNDGENEMRNVKKAFFCC